MELSDHELVGATAHNEVALLQGQVDCLDEALHHLSTGIEQDLYARTSLKLSETLSVLSACDTSFGDRAVEVFEKVWETRQLILSANSDWIALMFAGTLIRLYNTIGGIEYIQRLTENPILFSSLPPCEVARAFLHRFDRFQNVQDLRLSVHLWQRAISVDNLNNVEHHCLLLECSMKLYLVTRNKEAGTRCGEIARALSSIHDTLPAPNFDVLVLCAKGFLNHFDSGWPNESTRHFPGRSDKYHPHLRKGRTSVLSVANGVLHRDEKLGNAFERVFETNSDFNFLQAALTCLRWLHQYRLLFNCAYPSKFLSSLARVLFIRQVYLRSNSMKDPGEPMSIHVTSTGAKLVCLHGVEKCYLKCTALFPSEGSCMLAMHPLLPRLDALLAVRDEGDEDSEWFTLLNNITKADRVRVRTPPTTA